MNEYGGHKTLIQGMEKGPCALRKPTQKCPLCGLNYDYCSNEMGTQQYHKSLVYGTHAGRFSLTLGDPASLHNHYYMINFVIFFPLINIKLGLSHTRWEPVSIKKCRCQHHSHISNTGYIIATNVSN